MDLFSSMTVIVFSDIQIFDGHNGNAAAIFTREHLLNHVLGAIPRGLSREEWLQALPRALVAGFVKTDKEFQSRGMLFGLLLFISSFLFSKKILSLSFYLQSPAIFVMRDDELIISYHHLIISRRNIWNHSYICNS